MQVGGATGRIGDPSGRTTERSELKSSLVDENIFAICLDINKIFNNHLEYIWKDKDKLTPMKYVFIK